MPQNEAPNPQQRPLERLVRALVAMRPARFAALFLLVAVAVSVLIVVAIDLLWDGRFNAELQFAGVLTPLLDGLFIVIFVIAMFDEYRREVLRRQQAEERAHALNAELEGKVRKRTMQLLAAQQELLSQEKLAVLGQVAGSVGHELRHPLAVMHNAVYYLRSVLPDPAPGVHEYLDLLDGEIAGVGRIVSDLQDAVHPKPPRAESLVVGEQVALALRKCRPPASVSVSLDLPPMLPRLRADPMQLQQVLCNLIGNALEAMPDGGVLGIGAEGRKAGTLAISVRDTGCGIATADMERLFQPLFTTKPRRVGLGLMVVKHLTEVNGGRVEVQSEPGIGSTFTITLPVFEAGQSACDEEMGA